MQSRNFTHDIGYSGRNKSKPSIILQELRVTLAAITAFAITAFAITVIAAMILVQHEGGGGGERRKKLSIGDNTDRRNKMEKNFGNFGMRLGYMAIRTQRTRPHTNSALFCQFGPSFDPRPNWHLIKNTFYFLLPFLFTIANDLRRIFTLSFIII